MKNIVVMAREAPPRTVGDGITVHAFDPSRHVPVVELADLKNIDLLWRGQDARYARLLIDFESRFATFDVLVANWVNPFHPEWLANRFPSMVKIYGCIDDPHSSYRRTVGSLFAFDAAFGTTPSYAPGLSMEHALKQWGVPETTWCPLSAWVDPPPRLEVTPDHERDIEANWKSRPAGVLYVGGFYPSKYNRLVEWKRALGAELSIYGRWPLNGRADLAARLVGKLTNIGPERLRRAMRIAGWEDFVGHRSKGFLGRVRSLTNSERAREYFRHRIALNMHLSIRRETGNLRMYEAPFHGLMLLCDRGADDLHKTIFEEDREAVFYDDVEDGIDKARYYLKNDSARERIARAGYERVVREYTSDKCLLRFLKWATRVRKRSAGNYSPNETL